MGRLRPQTLTPLPPLPVLGVWSGLALNLRVLMSTEEADMVTQHCCHGAAGRPEEACRSVCKRVLSPRGQGTQRRNNRRHSLAPAPYVTRAHLRL